MIEAGLTAFDDRVGITGPKGCGRSTLLAAAAGLRKPDVGAVRPGDRLLYRRATPDFDHGLVATDVLTRIGLPANLAPATSEEWRQVQVDTRETSEIDLRIRRP